MSEKKTDWEDMRRHERASTAETALEAECTHDVEGGGVLGTAAPLDAVPGFAYVPDEDDKKTASIASFVKQHDLTSRFGGAVVGGLLLTAILPSGSQCILLVLTVCLYGVAFSYYLSRCGRNRVVRKRRWWAGREVANR